MDCLVCGKGFGLWARVTGDSDDAVCRECEKEGPAILEGFIGSISPDADLRPLYSGFDEAAKRYHIPEGKASPLRARLFEAIIVATSDVPDLSDDHVALVNEIAKRGGLGRVMAGTPVAIAASKINARQYIVEWLLGEAPCIACKGLLLQPEETCHWEEPARLLEQRTRREYAGGYGGISVPLGRGVRIHTGGFKGHPIDTTYLADCGMGWLHVTNQRLCFTGGDAAVAIPLKKLISVDGFEDGFQVFRTGAKRPTVFQVPFPELTLQLLALATPSPND